MKNICASLLNPNFKGLSFRAITMLVWIASIGSVKVSCVKLIGCRFIWLSGFGLRRVSLSWTRRSLHRRSKTRNKRHRLQLRWSHE